MDTSDPDIRFDSEGRCNHCTIFLQRMAAEVFPGEEGQRRLAPLVERIKRDGAGKEYDCVIGVSGGVDSTYVAYAVKQQGLRPLAVHFDNGWNSELAVDNIKKTLDKLGIELYTHVVDWEEFRDIQTAFLKASVPNAEIPTDHAINALLYGLAARHGVRYVITGSNVATEAILPYAWAYYNNDYRHLKAIHRRFGTLKMRTMPTLTLPKYLYYIFVRRIKLIRILNYVDYSKPKAMDVLQNELGWRAYGAKHFESVYTRFFQGYILPRKFGFDKRRAHFSCLVCTGDMTREAALQEMAKDAYHALPVEEEKAFVIKKLGLTPETFEAIMAAPPKDTSDYPSNAWLFHQFPQIKRWVRKIATDL
jgi:N-acetyl sugar amidotransferase